MAYNFFELSPRTSAHCQQLADGQSQSPDAVPRQAHLLGVSVEMQSDKVKFTAACYFLMYGETTRNKGIPDSLTFGLNLLGIPPDDTIVVNIDGSARP